MWAPHLRDFLKDCVHPYPGKNRSSWISLKEGKALILLSFKFAQFYWFSGVSALVSWSFFLSWNQSLAGLSWCPCVIWTWRWGRNSDLDNWETCVVWMHMALWLLEFAKHLWRDRYLGLIFWLKGLGIYNPTVFGVPEIAKQSAWASEILFESAAAHAPYLGHQLLYGEEWI